MWWNLGSGFYNVFMVDDDEDDIFTIRRGFRDRRSDINFHAAMSGEDLFTQLKALVPNEVHLIVIDINMPIMNGFEVLSHLKSVEEWCNIPVMVLSTSEHDVDRLKAKELGAVKFSTKFNSMKSLNRWVRDVEKFLEGPSPQIPLSNHLDQSCRAS